MVESPVAAMTLLLGFTSIPVLAGYCLSFEATAVSCLFGNRYCGERTLLAIRIRIRVGGPRD